MMVSVARDIPLVSPDREPKATTRAGSRYEIAIPLRNPGDSDAVIDTFLTRLWYAARRADLHLDGDTTDDWRTPGRLQDALRQISANLTCVTSLATAHSRLHSRGKEATAPS